MALCIIPARGGSKGIPYKNVVPVAGHPLVAWSIRQAMASAVCTRVIVATDCDEIAAVVEDEGADVFWRSSATATDQATSEECLLEVLHAQSKHDPLTVFLQATSPLRQPRDIDAAVAELHETGADSVFSARRVEGYCWRMCADGLYALHGERHMRQARTDAVWEENGSIYAFRTDVFMDERRRHCGKVAIYEMDPLDSFQIDEHADIGRLEELMALRLKHGHHATTT